MTEVEQQPNWHLVAWMKHFKKRQASLVNDLGWLKSRANKVWHGEQQYRREDVNEVASYLGIAPHELLMPPEDALALRRLREAAATIMNGGLAGPADPSIAKAAVERRSR